MTERAAYFALAGLSGRRTVLETLRSSRSAARAWKTLSPPGRDPEALLAEAEKREDRLITPADPDYPPVLLRLADPPLTLYLRGRSLPVGPTVAIVGSRAATGYGRATAERLGRELSRAGVTVISGLARGVDTAAHQGSLQVDGSGPVAVLGCGLDHDYPIENRSLKARLERQGTILSEYGRREAPAGWRFPARNRIIAALSKAVVLVEAGLRSGALITANHALDLGVEVMVVPGDVGHPNSQGILKLLREGATPIGGAEHVLEALGLDPLAYVPEPLEPVQERILSSLAPRGTLADELVLSTGLPIGEILSALGQLQVLGRVRRAGPAFLPV